MDVTEYMFGGDSKIMMLNLIIIILAIIIIVLLFMESANISLMKNSVDNFECPTCPSCPEMPDIPECPEYDSEGCPDCICDDSNCPSCPECPSCPDSQIQVKDIIDGIFPGRNTGLTSSGNYFPLDAMENAVVEPAFSSVSNLVPNYASADGIPSAISFEDEMLLNQNSSLGLATQKQPPMMSTQGVFTPSMDDSAGSSVEPSVEPAETEDTMDEETE